MNVKFWVSFRDVHRAYVYACVCAHSAPRQSRRTRASNLYTYRSCCREHLEVDRPPSGGWSGPSGGFQGESVARVTVMLVVRSRVADHSKTWSFEMELYGTPEQKLTSSPGSLTAG